MLKPENLQPIRDYVLRRIEETDGGDIACEYLGQMLATVEGLYEQRTEAAKRLERFMRLLHLATQDTGLKKGLRVNIATELGARLIEDHWGELALAALEAVEQGLGTGQLRNHAKRVLGGLSTMQGPLLKEAEQVVKDNRATPRLESAVKFISP